MIDNCFLINGYEDLDSAELMQYLISCIKTPRTVFIVFREKNVIFWNDSPCYENSRYPFPASRDERNKQIIMLLKQFGDRQGNITSAYEGYISSLDWHHDIQILNEIFYDNPAAERTNSFADYRTLQRAIYSFYHRD